MARKSKVSNGIVQLRDSILSGRWDQTDGYISEKELIEFLGLSKISVRKCIAALQKENFLRSVPYKGYVIGPAVNQIRLQEMCKNNFKKRLLFVEEIEKASGYHHRMIIDAAREEAEKYGFEFFLYDLSKETLLEEVKRDNDVLTTVALMKSDLDFVEPLIQCGVPAIMVEYLKEGIPVDSVIQDDRGGVEIAVNHLWEHNHKRIGLAVWGRSFYQPVRRIAAFSAALLRREIIEPSLVGVGQRFDREGGKECVRKLFENKEPPTAIIICHLEMAEGIFEELEKMGVEPGKDISLVAWGTEALKEQFLGRTKWANLPLDLIQWSRTEMGKMIVRIFEARIKDPLIPPMRVEIPTSLLKKGSVFKI